MKFETKRTLTDKVFATKIICEGYGDSELSETEEEALFEDFGPIFISTGREYKGIVEKDTKTNEIKVDIEKEISEENKAKAVSFIVNAVKIEVKPGMNIPYEVDAKKLKETNESLTAVELAEAKCRIFEKVIIKELTSKIMEFKKQATNFENEKIDSTII